MTETTKSTGSSYPSFSQSIGRGLMVLMILAPLAYCEAQSSGDRENSKVELAQMSIECAKAGGQWHHFRKICEAE